MVDWFNNNILRIFYRYLFVVIIGLGNLWVIYIILSPITSLSVLYSLRFFDPSASLDLASNSIIFFSYTIELVNACIAGAAYYLLIALNLVTPMNNFRQRIHSLAFSLGVFFIINLFRIVFFSLLVWFSYDLFLVTHTFFWYFLSIIMVFAVWILTIKVYNIDKIPLFSDMKLITLLGYKK